MDTPTPTYYAPRLSDLLACKSLYIDLPPFHNMVDPRKRMGSSGEPFLALEEI